MIPLEISVEEYVEHFPPAPNYIVVQRLFDYEKVAKNRSLYLPNQVIEQMPRFIGVGKVLAISPYESEFDHINRMREILMRPENGHVVFNFHVADDVKLMAELTLPKNSNVVLLCINDIIQIPKNLPLLLERQREFEAKTEAEGGVVANDQENLLTLQGGIVNPFGSNVIRTQGHD